MATKLYKGKSGLFLVTSTPRGSETMNAATAGHGPRKVTGNARRALLDERAPATADIRSWHPPEELARMAMPA